MCKKIILFGAGIYGKKALDFFEDANVYCFADNAKAGTIAYGKKVIGFEELLNICSEYDTVVSVSSSYIEEIDKQLKLADIEYRNFVDIYAEYLKLRPGNPKIEALKGKYQGEKIFLIGNGPSLTINDLERIQKNGYKTFACNFINKLFNRTDWRPDFYCCQEDSATALNKDFIINSPIKVKIIKEILRKEIWEKFIDLPDDIILFTSQGSRFVFSEDVSRIVYDGHTVMFTMLEFAIYMGFKEIYLIGVDNTMAPLPSTDNFNNLKSHFYEEDIKENEERSSIMRTANIDPNDWNWYSSRTNAHYGIARNFAESRGVNIFNATRGGKLEVFDRVDIDTLLSLSDNK